MRKTRPRPSLEALSTGVEPACAVGVWRSWLRLYRKPQSHLQNKSRRLLRLERAYQLWVFFIQPFLIPGKQIHGATMPEGKATLAVELGLKQPSFAGEALFSQSCQHRRHPCRIWPFAQPGARNSPNRVGSGIRPLPMESLVGCSEGLQCNQAGCFAGAKDRKSTRLNSSHSSISYA